MCKRSEMGMGHGEQGSKDLVAKDEGASRTGLEDTQGSHLFGLTFRKVFHC